MKHLHYPLKQDGCSDYFYNKNMENFFWNGEPCKARFLNIEILPTECQNMAWWKPFEGTTRQVIEVKSWGEPFLIDNEDGLGYSKITKGGGSFQHGSRHFDGVNHRVVSDVADSEIIKGFSPDKYEEIKAIENGYWAECEPEKHARLQAILEHGKKMRYHK